MISNKINRQAYASLLLRHLFSSLLENDDDRAGTKTHHHHRSNASSVRAVIILVPIHFPVLRSRREILRVRHELRVLFFQPHLPVFLVPANVPVLRYRTRGRFRLIFKHHVHWFLHVPVAFGAPTFVRRWNVRFVRAVDSTRR